MRTHSWQRDRDPGGGAAAPAGTRGSARPLGPRPVKSGRQGRCAGFSTGDSSLSPCSERQRLGARALTDLGCSATCQFSLVPSEASDLTLLRELLPVALRRQPVHMRHSSASRRAAHSLVPSLKSISINTRTRHPHHGCYLRSGSLLHDLLTRGKKGGCFQNLC